MNLGLEGGALAHLQGSVTRWARNLGVLLSRSGDSGCGNLVLPPRRGASLMNGVGCGGWVVEQMWDSCGANVKLDVGSLTHLDRRGDPLECGRHSGECLLSGGVATGFLANRSCSLIVELSTGAG